MKKNQLKYCVVLFLFFLSCFAFSYEFDLEDVSEEFLGTYIPMQYDNILISTRSHYDAMLSNEQQYYDILLLNKNICYSNIHFHDGYAILKEVFEDFRFIENTKGKFIIDNNGNSYRKISENVGNSGYVDFGSYVLAIIFEDVQALNDIVLNKNKIVIDRVEYSIILDSVFFETEGVAIWLRGNGNLYALVKDGIAAKLFESENERHRNLVSEKSLMEFPLFYWDDNHYPRINIWNISKDDLRYIRNLIYAKHGYIFRSEDLRNLYESFSWYKSNPSFSENDFSDDEKRLLENILKKEK